MKKIALRTEEKQYNDELKAMCSTALQEMAVAGEIERCICHSMIGWVTLKLDLHNTL